MLSESWIRFLSKMLAFSSAKVAEEGLTFPIPHSIKQTKKKQQNNIYTNFKHTRIDQLAHCSNNPRTINKQTSSFNLEILLMIKSLNQASSIEVTEEGERQTNKEIDLKLILVQRVKLFLDP